VLRPMTSVRNCRRAAAGVPTPQGSTPTSVSGCRRRPEPRMTLLPYDVTVALPVLTMAVALPSSSDAERMRRLGAVTSDREAAIVVEHGAVHDCRICHCRMCQSVETRDDQAAEILVDERILNDEARNRP